jgi:dihydropteroate synthase
MEPKTTIFPSLTSLEVRGIILDLSTPKVMGILNATPDSFFDGGKHQSVQQAVDHAGHMVQEGADMIDIGGMSSRPGAQIIETQEEMNRVLPVVEAVHAAFPAIPLSIDTLHASVAQAAIQAGAGILNDITAATYDEAMAAVAASAKVPMVLGHMQGIPLDMQHQPVYENVSKEVFDYLQERCRSLVAAGVNQIIIDPGFGFGKTLAHNYQLAAHLDQLLRLGFPILVGISRKSMINKLLHIKAIDALNGTTALHMHLLSKGAHILRVHDVKAAKEVIVIHQALLEGHNITFDQVGLQ